MRSKIELQSTVFVRLLVSGVGILCCAVAFAENEAQACKDGAGKLIVGEVVSSPTFKHGQFRKGVELSHTHLTLRAEDGTTYDVAIDNVFATGYVKNKNTVPSPINTIAIGDKIEVCGSPFPGGIHWVHTNCGDTPRTDAPNGWVKRFETGGAVGQNMEGSQTFCSLWP